ncbi:hypothetical protein MAL1_00168 [Bacteriophage DSS3_MAL1]|nr:hypothetical protein MAL1_00168 [Bacteriophage DSS3_MAL1]
MDHNKYHALRDAAVTSAKNSDFTALAALVEGGDMVYSTTDWSAWGDEQRLVFGIMTGAKLVQDTNDLTAIQGKDSFLQSSVGRLCCSLLDRDEVLEIAKIVWKDIK